MTSLLHPGTLAPQHPDTPAPQHPCTHAPMHPGTHAPAPKVSVLMSVFNGERYLREAVESILDQTFTDFEFIIVDDGSTDNTWQILQGYAASEPRIVLVRNETNVGVTRSLNKGLDLARGEYIARMDGDDVSLPERLAAQVAFLDESPEVGVVGCSEQVIDANGSPGDVGRYPTMHALILWTLCFHAAMQHPAAVFRKAIVEHVGGYDESFAQAQDRDLWQRLSSVTRLANLPEVHLLYRKHSDRVSSCHADMQARNSARAGQRLMTKLLGYSVPFEVSYNFRLKRFETMDDAIQAMRVIYSLYDAFMTRQSLSLSEKRAIRGDAAQRIVRLAWLFRHEAKMRRELLALTFRTNPLLTLLVAKLLLPGVLRKPWRLIVHQ